MAHLVVNVSGGGGVQDGVQDGVLTLVVDKTSLGRLPGLQKVLGTIQSYKPPRRPPQEEEGPKK